MKGLAQDPQFQSLKERYGTGAYSDDRILASALQAFRDRLNYDTFWYPETEEERKEFTSFIKKEKNSPGHLAKYITSEELDNSANAMYRAFTPEQMSNLVAVLASGFSGAVDILQEQRNTPWMSRQEIIDTLAKDGKNGFVVLLDTTFYTISQAQTAEYRRELCKKLHPQWTEEQVNAYQKDFDAFQAIGDKIRKNEQYIKLQAAKKIAENEGFVLDTETFRIQSASSYLEETTQETVQNEETESTNEDGVDKTESSKGDRYTDFRTLKLMEQLSPKAKRIIRRIPVINRDGTVDRDFLGYQKMLDPRTVAVVLHKVLLNATPDNFMQTLRDNAEFYPWLNGLADYLEKDTVRGGKIIEYGKDKQAIIYSNFKKVRYIYAYVVGGNNKYTASTSNSKDNGYALAKEAGNNMRSGFVVDPTYAVYNSEGNIRFGTREEVKAFRDKLEGKGGFVSNIFWARGELEQAQKKGYEWDPVRKVRMPMDAAKIEADFYKNNPTIYSDVASLLRGIGFVVSARDVEEAVKIPTVFKETDVFGKGSHEVSVVGIPKLARLVANAIHPFGACDYILRNNSYDHSGQYLYSISTQEMTEINNMLGSSKRDEYEERTVEGDKSLSTYNNPNILHEVFAELANQDGLPEEDYKQRLRDNYGQYEGMSLGSGDKMQMTGYLDYLDKHFDTETRRLFQVVNLPAFNHVDYAGLTRAQKLTASMMMYFKHPVGDSRDYYGRFVEVPIQSDYETAHDFINVPNFHMPELYQLLADEVEVEIERMNAIRARQRNSYDADGDPVRPIANTYETQGQRFTIFPEMNSNGFIERYQNGQTTILEEVTRLLDEQVVRDMQMINDSGILTNRMLSDIGFNSSDGTVESLREEEQVELREWAANTFYARQQIAKLLTGGLSQFKGLLDYEKRNMFPHANRIPVYTKATWRGKPVFKKDTESVVYMGDDQSKSEVYDQLSDLIDSLTTPDDKGLISKAQAKAFKKEYEKIKTTDGYGLRSLDSYRAIKVGTGQWNSQLETAYNRIKQGKPTRRDIDLFMQAIKPIYTGYEVIPGRNGDKPIKLTVLHKYSEGVLLPVELAKFSTQARSVPFQALDKVQKEKNIDLFVFESCVKVGGHTVLAPFAKEGNNPGGDRLFKTADEIANHMTSKIDKMPFAVHELSLKYYGIAASTPAHGADDEIAWASQAQKEAWANIQPGEKLVFGDKELADNNGAITTEKGRDLFGQVKAAEIISQYSIVKSLFKQNRALEKAFQEEIASKSYSGNELILALRSLGNGQFVVPLFSPSVAHEVQALLSSILRKRLSKIKTKGANMLQAPGLGMDLEHSSFSELNALANDDKLRIVFDETGKSRRIKYVEAYVPITDSRLAKYADENGEITPERLNRLVDEGVIDGDILNFIAYRTPSDAEHSIIPCRIKGFVSNTGGATIILPKEIMKMTGHDYDGDKLRCHFMDFEEVENDEVSDDAVVRQVLGQTEAFKKIRKIVYDYTKSPMDNVGIRNANPDLRKLNNAMIELMFSNLTTPSGSARVVVPGGSAETHIYGKALYLTRAASDSSVKQVIIDAFEDRLGVSPSDVRTYVRDSVFLYNELIKLNEGQIGELMDAVAGVESPYSLSHSIDSYEYIMTGAEMIGIYALYNSAHAMFQRLNLSYIPRTTKNKDGSVVPFEVSIFGHPINKLFEKKDRTGRLSILGLSRLLNAAVDNAKDPVLGYLNQTKDLAEMTNFLFAAGFTEEDIHLLFNQPAVIELAQRLKGNNDASFIDEANKIISELTNLVNDGLSENDQKKAISSFTAVARIKSYTREQFISQLGYSYNDIISEKRTGLVKQQCAVLGTLVHLQPAASELAQFVKLTRPESDAGGIDSSVSGTMTKLMALNKFRNDRAGGKTYINGINDVIERRFVTGMSGKRIFEEVGNKLPEVVAMNTLLKDNFMQMMSQYFPQAKDSWFSVINELSDMYTYKTPQPGVVEKIANDAILWKLLSNHKFINGEPQSEQDRILKEVPQTLRKLNERLNKSRENSETDKEARRALEGNIFFSHLSLTSPVNSNSGIPRIRFELNGPYLENTSDTIRAYWDRLVASSDPEISQFAIDLFKYNLYTNGFSYGRYEFAHFAPLTVLYKCKGYIDALYDVLSSDWSSENDRENFINQYCMNHWGDKKFLKTVNFEDMPNEFRTAVGLSTIDDNKAGVSDYDDVRYIIARPKGYGSRQAVPMLYRVVKDAYGKAIGIIKAEKLGVRNRYSQITEQYNPSISFQEIKPILNSNEYSWGEHDEMKGPVRRTEARTEEEAYQQMTGGAALSPQAMASAYQQMLGGMGQMQEQTSAAVTKNNNVLSGAETAKEGIPVDSEETRQLPVENDVEFNGTGVPSSINMGGLNMMIPPSLDGKNLFIVTRNPDGTVSEKQYPVTPWAIGKARRQEVFHRLNEKLRQIIQDAGGDVRALTGVEARMAIGGITDFDTAELAAEGIKGCIRIAEGHAGELALPEEFAHMAIELLGYDNPLVARLLNTLQNNEAALREAFSGDYDAYLDAYRGNENKMVVEAAGKLVAKQLFLNEAVGTKSVKSILNRVIEAIKNFFRRISGKRVNDAILDANGVASQLARDLLGGRLLDQMSVENVRMTGQLLNIKSDISEKSDIVSKFIKNEMKRLAILNKRMANWTTSNDSMSSPSIVQAEIDALNGSIEKAKVEDTVLFYLNYSLDFLQKTYDSLVDSLSSSVPENANKLCKKLNIVRDTLYGFAQSIEDIREALRDKEIADSVELATELANVSNLVENLNMKYQQIAVEMFENMLAGVYGEDGVDIKIGRQRGRHISIHEMARRTDSDVSLMKRWFYALSDAPDFALRAIDDVVRTAKEQARANVISIRPRLEAAVAKLIRETGSSDTSWMLQTSGGKRTGMYISEAEAKALGKPYLDFRNTIMEIKHDADRFIPETKRKPDQMVFLRKYTAERVKTADGLKGKWDEVWKGLKYALREEGEVDFENEQVLVDFEGNRIDNLALKFVEKGKNETYEDMTDDVATAILAYVEMVNEYNSMNNIIGIIENAKYMASQRDVVQKKGIKTQRESVSNTGNDDVDYQFNRPFTKKQARTRLQEMLEDFFSMHVYGHLQKDEGTIGRTKFSKRKIVNALNAIVSYSQMALNLPQRVANVNTGLSQILIETAGKGKFNIKDVTWGTAIWTKNTADRLADTGKTDYDNYLSLFMDKFDVHQDNGRNLMDKRYKKSRAGRVINSNLLFAGLNIGEDYLSGVTALAIARNFKMKDAEGNECTLYDAYEVDYYDREHKTGAFLKLKDGYTKADGTPLTAEDERRYMKEVAASNFELQGIYNVDDRSAVQQYALGALIIMYRKWIAPALKRRYEGLFNDSANYSIMKGDFTEGYYTTFFHWIADSFKDGKAAISAEESEGVMLGIVDKINAMISSFKLNSANMTPYERGNMKKAFTELCVVIGLMATSTLLAKLPPDDHDGNEFLSWADHFVLSQLLRLRSDLGSQAPTHMQVQEFLRILDSPFAAIGPIKSTLNLFQFFIPSNYTTEVKSGRYKGHTKAYKYFRELPYISMLKKVDNWFDPSGLISYYSAQQ